MKTNSITCSAGRYFRTLFLVFTLFALAGQAFGQCKPSILVDNKLTVVDPTDPFGLELPMWMGAGQTLAVGASVNSISVIEFVINGSALEFGQILSITSDTPVTVPNDRAWKVESVVKQNTPSAYRSVSYTIPGTYTFTVPACASEICIEAWGGGGGGSASPTSAAAGSGGGGAGYGSGCYSVTPSQNLTVVVGTGGNGGPSAAAAGQNGQDSSVGSLISAGGGFGSSSPTSAGAAGSSSGINVVQGGAGFLGSTVNCSGFSGRGGAAGNGGAGGNPSDVGQAGQPGAAPGGGGSGGGTGTCSGWRAGGAGGAGRVNITW